MKKIMLSVASAAAIAMGTLPVLAAVVEYRAYAAPNNDVLILPTTTKTVLTPLNNGAVITGGGTVTLSNGSTVTLPTTLSSGLLLNSTGTVLSNNAYVTPGGKLIMHRMNRRILMPRRALIVR